VVYNILIVLNLTYLFFNFITCHLIFYVFFLSNLIFILFIPIYFAINLFSDWILFFNLIPNHLILIFFVEFDSHYFLLQILLFWLISMILFLSISSLIVLSNWIFISYWKLFYYVFKTQFRSWFPSCSKTLVGLND